ncbi:hypothetical protein F5884DRAFT_304576 [Xylogone sp. PMI_703]|nr:hypothetical protein F5884DRAFT_304576 [Xylogone sp. PMI_703]
MAGTCSDLYPPPRSGVPILTLPDEVLQLITTLLPNKDIKSLRLANRRLRINSILRIERVFISPSYKNIKVFYAIADHEQFRKQVKEVVWDDARFNRYLTSDEERKDQSWEPILFNIYRFRTECVGNLKQWGLKSAAEIVRLRTGRYPDKSEKLMSLDENFALYRQFYKEQQEIIKAGSDVEALRKGLSAFVALQRVTVTNETHRASIYNPRYPTPMIRSFPPSFNYPIPWGWCGDSTEMDLFKSWHDLRDGWHGLNIVLEELSLHKRALLELVIDANRETIGIPYHFFRTDSKDFKNLRTICSRGLKRLDLAINVWHFEDCPGLGFLPESLLKSALLTAGSIQHFSIHTSALTERNDYGDDEFDGCTDTLKAIPVEEWPSLRHLTISHLPLLAEDLLGFLKKLPPATTSLEFISLRILRGSWAELLQRFKDDFHWRGNHPRIIIATPGYSPYRKIWIQDEVARFLDGGHNPFIGMHSRNRIQLGFGTVRDDFDDTFEKPHEPDKPSPVQARLSYDEYL